MTFDAGSDSGHAPHILDVLAANAIHATFAITGRWAQANAGLVQRMANDGHQIVNHTWDHTSLTAAIRGARSLAASERIAELTRTDTIIRQITGSSTDGWFRPPYGDRNASVDADAGAAGYRFDLMWTLDSLGWKGIPAATITARCLSGAEPGAIILFHVGSASADADALPAIISGLRAAGYDFATATQIL